jgi:hypothetical protein
MVHQAHRRQCHAPGPAQGPKAPALATESQRLVVAAVAAVQPQEAARQDAALQVFAKRLLYISRWRGRWTPWAVSPLADGASGKPSPNELLKYFALRRGREI